MCSIEPHFPFFKAARNSRVNWGFWFRQTRKYNLTVGCQLYCSLKECVASVSPTAPCASFLILTVPLSMKSVYILGVSVLLCEWWVQESSKYNTLQFVVQYMISFSRLPNQVQYSISVPSSSGYQYLHNQPICTSTFRSCYIEFSISTCHSC